jgi:hypothetical protein
MWLEKRPTKKPRDSLYRAVRVRYRDSKVFKPLFSKHKFFVGSEHNLSEIRYQNLYLTAIQLEGWMTTNASESFYIDPLKNHFVR